MAADSGLPPRLEVPIEIPRSSRAETRNPLLKLRAAQAMAELPEQATRLLALLLTEAAVECRAVAEHAWSTRKPPLAAYWAKWAVEMRHVRGLLNKAWRTGVARLIAVDRDLLAKVLLTAPCGCPPNPTERQVCGRCRLQHQVEASRAEDAGAAATEGVL